MKARRIFIVIGHDLPLDGTFSLEDLPGSGRIDEIARCVTAALLVSNGIRREAVILLVLQGDGDTKVVEFQGKNMKNLNPDERSTAALIRIALKEEIFIFEKKVLPGIKLIPGDLRTLIEKIDESSYVVHLHEDGGDAFNMCVTDLIKTSMNDKQTLLIILSDNLDLSSEEAEIISEIPPFPLSLGPVSLQSHQAILVMHNLLDRLLL
ncbi:MAG: hypothetical protein QF682_03280 [Candidatus Thermoplasmatota archaeon]|jgi:tRNA (pseudouridine54-N1)-methyltransferase|nr:hypothetical protein [Candidatus Thermoplasmatota archaeon]